MIWYFLNLTSPALTFQRPRLWLKFLAGLCLPISNFWMALISEQLVWFGWITSQWKAIMLSDISNFSWHYPILFNLLVYLFLILVYLLATNGWSVYRPLKKLTEKLSAMLRGSAPQKLEEKRFSVKIWLIIRKICLRQRKMNGNDTITFSYFEKATQ